jgi:hypothetical protein
MASTPGGHARDIGCRDSRRRLDVISRATITTADENRSTYSDIRQITAGAPAGRVRVARTIFDVFRAVRTASATAWSL